MKVIKLTCHRRVYEFDNLRCLLPVHWEPPLCSAYAVSWTCILATFARQRGQYGTCDHPAHLCCRDHIEHQILCEDTKIAPHNKWQKQEGWRAWRPAPLVCTRAPLKRATLPSRYVGIAYAPCLCEDREEDLCPRRTLGILRAPL